MSANLRTRIVILESSAIQLVIKNGCHWNDEEKCLLPVHRQRSLDIDYGLPLCDYSLIHHGGAKYFCLKLHHSIFDGWSLRLVMGTLQSIYDATDISPLYSYSRFIKYNLDMDHAASAQYWTAQLEGAKSAAFPAESERNKNDVKKQMKLQTTSIKLQQLANSFITKATVIRAAWAIVLARYNGVDDICFGSSVSGRHAAVAGIESIPGLVVTTVPVRIRIDDRQTVSSFLKDVQYQAADMVPYEHFGLKNIANLNKEAKAACDFKALFVVQPVQQMSHESSLFNLTTDVEGSSKEELLQNYLNYPLVAQCMLAEDRVDLDLYCDLSVIPEHQLQGLSHTFKHVTEQLLNANELPLSQISVVPPWEYDFAVAANGAPPTTIERCVHSLIESEANKHPTSMAVNGWDADFTYQQLDLCANRLAHHLINTFNVKIGDIVHMCFEKSAWYIVAILAVNKTGAAWSPLDSSHPCHTS
ncbi:putative NRPS-like protein biosynthetic cluster [Trichoderma virens FT-333]|nr:putative NRPS-like protein biosynthetic cluster [Trichoderma virens FT-333]